jgi:GGDEF domain-containing protein
MGLSCQRSDATTSRLVVLRVGFVLIFSIVISHSIVDSEALIAQTKSANEYQVKAAFLYNFVKFVDWPPSAFTSPNQPLAICVYGREPFGTALEDALLGKTIGERRIALVRATQFQELVGCHVVFVSASEHEPTADLNMADEALYRAKQMGRNRVELAVAPEHAAVPSSDSPSADHVMKAESR